MRGCCRPVVLSGSKVNQGEFAVFFFRKIKTEPDKKRKKKRKKAVPFSEWEKERINSISS